MKLLIAVSVMILVATGAMAQVVEAQAFVLIDSQGNHRGEFMMTDHGPSLFLSDSKDNTVVEISVTETHAIMRFFDIEGGQLRFSILVAQDIGAAVLIADKNNTPRIDLGMLDQPFIHIYDANGKQFWWAP